MKGHFIKTLLQGGLGLATGIIIVCIIPSGVFANILFEDNFDANDSTSLSQHNPNWEGYVGFDNGIITENQVHSSNGLNSTYYIPYLLNKTDYCVQADFPIPLAQTPIGDYFAITTRRDATQSTHVYLAGYAINGGIFFSKDYGPPLFNIDKPNLKDGIHTMKLCSSGPSHSLFLDGDKLTTVEDNTYLSGAPGFDVGNNAPIDNFIVSSIDADPLIVPLIKQTDPFWKSMIYDSAKRWSPKDPTIGSWGCALTSAVMVLNYYNILKLPDTSFITPGTLNKWLLKQKDGYIGNGLVNWLAISRLTKLAKTSGHNPNFSYDALEFDRKAGHNTTQLTEDLQNGQPDILEMPGHFTVAKGIQDTTFAINDPYFSYTTLAEGYNNTFKSLSRYIPSNTDLSYFLIIGPKDQQISLTDINNNSLGDTFVQDPLLNDITLEESGQPVTELLLKNPTTGNYSLKISGKETDLYSFDLYLYDKEGNPFTKTINGLVSSNNPDFITFSYDHNNQSNSSIQKEVNFDLIIGDINEGIALKKIDQNIGKGLISLIQTSQRLSSTNRIASKITLKTTQTILKSTKPILISKEVYTILNDELTSLIRSI